MKRILGLVLILACSGAYAEDQIGVLRRAILIAGTNHVTVRLSHDTSSDTAAMFSPDDDAILVNVGNGYWEAPESNQKNSFARRMHSSGHPDHIIRHEIAHVIMYRLIGREAILRLRGLPVFDEGYVREHVGFYAAGCETEFFAEVHAGKQAGIVYPKPILDHYDDLLKGLR